MSNRILLETAGIEHIDLTPTTINPLDMHKMLKRKDIVNNGANGLVVASAISSDVPQGETLDVTNWLPSAAKVYNISPNIDDYLMVPVFTIPSELPNRNGVGFPLEELVAFSPEDGMQYYKTFKGKPTHYEHANKDYTIAKGVIADVYLRRLDGWSENKIYKMVELLMFDRTRDVDLCNDILKGRINAYSMGAYVGGYTCSMCGGLMGTCSHLHPDKKLDFYKLGNHLVYRRVKKPRGFETSAVGTPAYSVAAQDTVIPINNSETLITR